MPTKRQIQTGLNRLTKLADWLEANVKPEKFNIDTIVSSNVKKLDTVKECLKKFDCGSTACAMGYTPMVFPKLVSYSYCYGRIGLTTNRESDCKHYSYIAEDLFFISCGDTEFLFSMYQPDEHEKTLAGTIARIRRFVAAKKEKKCHSTPTT